MRKGTKSCAECRRRKIKCIYQDNRDICRDCFERGSECVDQEHAQLTEPKSITDSSQSLRGRVSQLEDLVKQLVGKLDESRSPDVSRDDRRGSSPASTASYRLDRPAIKRRWQVGAKGGKIVTAAAETSLPRHQQEQRDPDAKTDLGMSHCFSYQGTRIRRVTHNSRRSRLRPAAAAPNSSHSPRSRASPLVYCVATLSLKYPLLLTPSL